MRLRLLIYIICGCFAMAMLNSEEACAQLPPRATKPALPSVKEGKRQSTMPDTVSVGILTCAPGADIYQLEGHAALRIKGRTHDLPFDWVYNWGMFDFNSPNFVYRFVKGETDYWMDAEPWPIFAEHYKDEGRTIIEHPIPLDSLQTQRLLDLVYENSLPGNRVYRYNYVKDNCATRPLRLIELALGDTIILPEPEKISRDDRTFRQVMRTHHKNYPWYQLGIDLALGSGLDLPITARDKSFAPTVLEDQLSRATVGGRPLTGTPQIASPGRPDTIDPPTPWYATPLAAGWALFVLTLAISIIDVIRGEVSRWYDTLLYTLYGAAGIVIAFLVFVSTHEASSPNWLLMWLNPLCFIVPIFIWLKKCKSVVLSYQIINFALILGMLVVWPFTGQCGNAAFVPLIGSDLLRSVTFIIVITHPKPGEYYRTLTSKNR